MDSLKTNNVNIKVPKEFNSKLTKYEKARILGTRASQIQYGAEVNFPKKLLETKTKKELMDKLKGKNTYEIAKEEFENGLNPLIIVRNYPSGEKKEITVQEMA